MATLFSALALSASAAAQYEFQHRAHVRELGNQVDSEFVQYLTKHPFAPGEPVRMDLYWSSECPYSQEFMTRQIPKLARKKDIPLDLKMHGKMYDVWDPEHKCTPTTEKTKLWMRHGGQIKQQEVACRVNLALMCAWNTEKFPNIKEPEYRLKLADYTEDLMNHMQQWQFNTTIADMGLGLVKRITDRYLDFETVLACMDGPEGDGYAQFALDNWDKVKAISKKHASGYVIGIFPWLLIKDQPLYIDHGLMQDPRARTLIDVACIAEPDHAACKDVLKHISMKNQLLQSNSSNDWESKVNGSPVLRMLPSSLLVVAILGLAVFIVSTWKRSRERNVVMRRMPIDEAEAFLEPLEPGIATMSNMQMITSDCAAGPAPEGEQQC